MRKGQIVDPYIRAMQRSFEGPTVSLNLGPCLDCSYHLDCDGYPTIWDTRRGSSVKISRVVLANILGREIHSGLCALHHCDRPACIRGSHLYEGTLSQNSQDRDRRHGNPCLKGSAQCSAKLTETDIKTIRQMFKENYAQQDIAWMFDVSGSVVSNILSGKAWRQVAQA